MRRRALLNTVRTVRKDKRILFIPLLVILACTAFGLWGVFASADQEKRQRLTNAHSRAVDKARTIASELRACVLPVKVMMSFVTRSPSFPGLEAVFPSLAAELMSLTAAGSVANMQLAPLGVVAAIQPLAGNELAIGHDLLKDPKNRNLALRTIATGNLTLAGPYNLVQGYVGAPARFPIYVSDVDANETFGRPADATNCSICYDPATRTKFWGFATVMINWDVFVNQVVVIGDLAAQGLSYRLVRRDDALTDAVVWLAGSRTELHDPVRIHIPVPNNLWCLTVMDERGWEPTWKWPLVATVIALSLILGSLVALALLGRAQQRLLLLEVLHANEQLEDAALVLLREKDRAEALLKRQYNLIECLGGDPTEADTEGGAAGEEGVVRTSHPADKIEKMRKKLLNSLRPSRNGRGASSGVGGLGSAAASGDVRGGGADGAGGGGHGARTSADNMELVMSEMIGEGTFGKVYRGLWRGSEVAIKTMVLPANMSGKEKREKMAVMEAAISSSLAHPNVVATYTYQIKPLKDSSSSSGRVSDDLTSSAIIVGGDRTSVAAPDASSAPSPVHQTPSRQDDGGRGGIHSYEVQLVLEFCDKGCLREALDEGIFFGSAGLNYPAILDTAADVAKALLHLHLNDVLHGDLKADNVMLKSCGGEGRGMSAKVADFGLAIKMDHMSTHVSRTFQGTLTHMAPEVLLHGQVSKAADVFAFGITMWEIFTGGNPYPGVPGALLGHLISREGRRPAFPPGTPSAYRELAERCWAPEPANRPSFDEILSTLTALRAAEPSPTPSLRFSPMTPEERRRKRAEQDRPLSGIGGAPGASGALTAKLRARAAAVAAAAATDGSRASSSAPLPAALGQPPSALPQLHTHYRPRSGVGVVAALPPESVRPPRSADGAAPPPSRLASCSRSSGGGGGGGRRSRSRSKADDPIIMVGGRNVSLSNAITSKSVVLEPISETRYEGDPDAPALELV
ncbi:hypothetical protein GPECTOR_32g527 [Gonium pectorale]|uniref:Protein kinase domain-containing protein n=1 Tax=Gonium pectorale TaxID=33097 RepID=A0A150GDJ7_GONPE|nr:hypothetical protein GPECTOR_32g527 [Gonium pectorale]|eukprot:KXZ47914.1 hypothetical protein GPECTOR_32g527 [Gonium pectorale]